MKRILGIGNALVDIMTIVDNEDVLERFSLPKGSMTLVNEEKSLIVMKGTHGLKKSLSSGGSAANTIHGLGKLGLPTGFIGSIGIDEIGDFFENDMKSAGVETLMKKQKSVTGTAVALITPDSERTFATHLGAAVELSAEMLNKNDFASYDLLYLEGYLIYNRLLVERACQIAKENNMTVALDLASFNVVSERLNDFRDIISNYVDIVFANEEEAKAFTGMDAEKALNEISKYCDIAILKVGKNGSWIKKNDKVIKVESILADCIDTTGAGDLYAAGFLYGMAMNEPLEKCGKYGSLMSGKVIEVVGAKMGEDRWAAIRKEIQPEKIK